MQKGVHLRAFASRATLLAALLLASAVAAHAADPQTVDHVDLGRYVGRWYEIGRFPNAFQSHCVSDVTATYRSRADGRIDVLNRCRRTTGELDDAVGVARVADEKTHAKLKVRFAPAFLSFLPFVWGDYWVLGLGSGYEWAVVGTPDRQYLWILARNPQIADEHYEAALALARAQGFDVARIVRTEHLPATEAPSAATP